MRLVTLEEGGRIAVFYSVKQRRKNWKDLFGGCVSLPGVLRRALCLHAVCKHKNILCTSAKKACALPANSDPRVSPAGEEEGFFGE